MVTVYWQSVVYSGCARPGEQHRFVFQTTYSISWQQAVSINHVRFTSIRESRLEPNMTLYVGGGGGGGHWFTYVGLCVCTYVCMHACVHACMYVYVCIRMCVYVGIRMYMYVYVCMYLYGCIHVLIYGWMYACMYVCRYYVCMQVKRVTSVYDAPPP